MIRNQFVATAIRGSLGLALALAVGMTEAWALDRDIVNAAGFEAPSFTTTFLGTGQLEGQVNPPGFGQIISPGQWLRPQGVQTGTGVVQSTVFAPGGGTQAVQINRVGNSPDRWGIPVNNQAYPEYPAANVPPGETLQPCLCISWDMRVEGPAGVPGVDNGPFFGVEANDDDVNGLKLIGSLGVNATSGEVIYQAPGTGFLTAAGPVTVFGTWHNYQMKLDYATKSYTIYYDYVPRGTFAFVDNSLADPIDQFSEANIVALAASGAPADLVRAGTAFFDNFLAREGMCIPEPGTVVLAVGSLAFVLSLVRRRSAAVCQN